MIINMIYVMDVLAIFAAILSAYVAINKNFGFINVLAGLCCICFIIVLILINVSAGHITIIF